MSDAQGILNNPISVILSGNKNYVDRVPYKRIRSRIKRITTTNLTRQSAPDLRISNPYNLNSLVLETGNNS